MVNVPDSDADIDIDAGGDGDVVISETMEIEERSSMDTLVEKAGAALNWIKWW